jgi:hypothetical protein
MLAGNGKVALFYASVILALIVGSLGCFDEKFLWNRNPLMVRSPATFALGSLSPDTPLFENRVGGHVLLSTAYKKRFSRRF